jgi:hypothetical protein
MRRFSIISLLLGCGFALAACGDSESKSDKEILAAINYALVSTAPGACTEAKTQAFLEQMFRQEGAGVLKMCEQNARAEESPNDPVEVTNVEVGGSRATAEIGLTDDGDATGQVFAAALVKEDGNWKLDEFTGFAEFDQGRWVEEQREGLEASYSVTEPQVADCIVEAYQEMLRPEIEEMILGGSARPELEIGERCERP